MFHTAARSMEQCSTRKILINSKITAVWILQTSLAFARVADCFTGGRALCSGLHSSALPPLSPVF